MIAPNGEICKQHLLPIKNLGPIGAMKVFRNVGIKNRLLRSLETLLPRSLGKLVPWAPMNIPRDIGIKIGDVHINSSYDIPRCLGT